MADTIFVLVGRTHWHAFVSMSGPKPNAPPFASRTSAAGAAVGAATAVGVVVAGAGARLPIRVSQMVAYQTARQLQLFRIVPHGGRTVDEYVSTTVSVMVIVLNVVTVVLGSPFLPTTAEQKALTAGLGNSLARRLIRGLNLGSVHALEACRRCRPTEDADTSGHASRATRNGQHTRKNILKTVCAGRRERTYLPRCTHLTAAATCVGRTWFWSLPANLLWFRC